MKHILAVAITAILLATYTKATIVYPRSTVSAHFAAATEDPGPAPECPFPSDELVYFPVTTNCSKYWECFQGNRYLMSCPSGLYWNTNSNYCDYPDNVDCNRGTTATTPTTTTTNPGTNTTVTPGGNTPDPECPYPSEGITFLPHPSDCSQYYECVDGKKYVMSCPSGLYWNHVANTCDYQENVDCDRVITTSSTVTSSPTTTTINPTCTGQVDGSYLPHPTDCTKFYECVGGHAIEEQCPSGLYWNQEAHTCDYPEHVACSTKAAK